MTGKHENKICENCGNPFECRVGDIQRCDCNSVSLTQNERDFIARNFSDCLCVACMKRIKSEVEIKVETGEDYYFENGLMVFTEAYHLKRGYCCKSECRHCPWHYRK